MPDIRSLFAMVARLAAGLLIGLTQVQAQQMRIPMGDPEGLAVTQASIERHGVTWTFQREHVAGKFANGDPWVLGSVEIVAIHPTCTYGARTEKHLLVARLAQAAPRTLGERSMRRGVLLSWHRTYI